MAKKPKTKSKNTRSKNARSKRIVLTEQQKEQRAPKKEIRTLMSNMGFKTMPKIDGTEFVYEGRTSEMDDIFYSENIILLTEYTIKKSVSSHLINKKVIYDKIKADTAAFLRFLIDNEKFKPFADVFNSEILSGYTIKQVQVRVLYASKYQIPSEHKLIVNNIHYFDYPIVKYFESIANVIKKTAKHEFFDFLDIPFSKIGQNVKETSLGSSQDFSGHILPEEHSSFDDGYKIVSFYIDAESLLKRAFVLRNEGWRNSENIGLYQRMLVTTKMRKLRKYLHEVGRVFINNIIVTIPVDRIKLFGENEQELIIDDNGDIRNSEDTKIQPTIIKIADVSGIIGIIDGQHRSYAYHEGDDIYEKSIAKLRGIQNLLVTGILYPKNENKDKRLKFEAKLFLEINATQSGAGSGLKQEIEFNLIPFSTTSIAKYVINQLNASGPLDTMFEQYSYEKDKIKTASIISFGLKPLLKFDGADSLFKTWGNPNKDNLKKKEENFALLKEYKDYSVTEIRNLLIGFKQNIPKERWVMNRVDAGAILNVTTINGMINCLRILIENGKSGDVEYYKLKLKEVAQFDFKKYKSSQYRKMGQDIYDTYFNSI
jgi:DGQHR domain-containing protein